VTGGASDLGSADGAGCAAQFRPHPPHHQGIVVDTKGNIYLRIQKTIRFGKLIRLEWSLRWRGAPIKSVSTVDPAGNLYVCEAIKIRKTTPARNIIFVLRPCGSSGSSD